MPSFDAFTKFVGGKTILIFGVVQVFLWMSGAMFLVKFEKSILLGPKFISRRSTHLAWLAPMLFSGGLGVLTGVKRKVKHCRVYWLSLLVSIICMLPLLCVVARLSCDCVNFEQCEALLDFAAAQDATFVNRYHMPAWLDSHKGFQKRRKVHVKKSPGGVPLPPASFRQEKASVTSSPNHIRPILERVRSNVGSTLSVDSAHEPKSIARKRSSFLGRLWSGESSSAAEKEAGPSQGASVPIGALRKDLSAVNRSLGALVEEADERLRQSQNPPPAAHPLKAAVHHDAALDPEHSGTSIRETFDLTIDLATPYANAGGSPKCTTHDVQDKIDLLGRVRICRAPDGSCTSASASGAESDCATRKTLAECHAPGGSGKHCAWYSAHEATALAKDVCPDPLYEAVVACALDLKSACGGLRVRVYPSDHKGGFIREWGDHKLDDFVHENDWQMEICFMNKEPGPRAMLGKEHRIDPDKSFEYFFVKDKQASVGADGEDAKKALRTRQLSIGTIDEYWASMVFEHQKRCHCMYPGDSCQIETAKDEDGSSARQWCQLAPSEENQEECLAKGVKPIRAKDGAIWARELCEEPPKADSHGVPGCNCVNDIPLRLPESEMKQVRPEFVASASGSTVIGNSCQLWFKDDQAPWCVTGFDSACPDRQEIPIGLGHSKVYKSAVPCDTEYSDVVDNAEDFCFPVRNTLLVLFVVVAAAHPPMLLIVYVFLSTHCGDQEVVEDAYDIVIADGFGDGDEPDDDSDDDDDDREDGDAASDGSWGSGAGSDAALKGKSAEKSTGSKSKGGKSKPK